MLLFAYFGYDGARGRPDVAASGPPLGEFPGTSDEVKPSKSPVFDMSAPWSADVVLSGDFVGVVLTKLRMPPGGFEEIRGKPINQFEERTVPVCEPGAPTRFTHPPAPFR